MKSTVGICIAVAFAVMGLVGTVSADVITWGSPTDIAASSDVSTNGTLVFAANGGSQTPVTVNGVTFGVDSQFPISLGNTNTGSTGDSAYDTLLDDFGSPFVTNANFSPLGTYVQGNTYEIQIWQAAGSDLGDTTLDDGNGNLVTLTGSSGAVGGQYVIGTFVADDAIAPIISMDGNPSYNAYQVRDITPVSVPEPSSLGLLGIAGLGALIRRRRR